jgi:hypothetical protein
MTKLEILISQANSAGATDQGRIFRAVLRALTESAPLDLSRLYELPYDDFELVMEALREWRLQRYLYGTVHIGPHPVSPQDSAAAPAEPGVPVA